NRYSQKDKNEAKTEHGMERAGKRQADTNAPSLQELEFLFSLLFKEYFTAGNQSVSKSSSLSDNSTKPNTQPTTNVQPTTEPITPTTTVTAEETIPIFKQQFK
ncbi:hypothetical protein Tco_0959566, partial [Tanacetum coccineum]